MIIKWFSKILIKDFSAGLFRIDKNNWSVKVIQLSPLSKNFKVKHHSMKIHKSISLSF